MFTNFNASSGLTISRANTLYVKNAGGSTIQSSNTGIVGLTIQTISSQTANLLEKKQNKQFKHQSHKKKIIMYLMNCHSHNLFYLIII